MTLDAAVLSDDHVAQRYGGFFTGAFVGLVAVDLSGYGKEAIFSPFRLHGNMMTPGGFPDNQGSRLTIRHWGMKGDTCGKRQ